MAPISSADVAGVRELSVIVVFGVLTTAVVGGRFWARFERKTPLAANDYAVLVALVFTWAVNIEAIVACVRAAAGEPKQEVTGEELLITTKLLVAFPALWAPAVAAYKIAVLLLYLTIFRSNRVFTIITYGLIVISFCYGLATMLAGLTICYPFSENLHPTPGSACSHELLFYLITAIINLVIDVTIFLLPLPMLWHLQTSTTRKIHLSIVFGIGLLTCLTSIFKALAVHQVVVSDIARTSVLDWIWSALEPDFGIVCACLPVMQPLWTCVKGYFTSFGGSRETSQRSLRFSPRERRDGRKSRPPVEDQLYPLSKVEATHHDVELSETRSASEVEHGGSTERVADFNR